MDKENSLVKYFSTNAKLKFADGGEETMTEK